MNDLSSTDYCNQPKRTFFTPFSDEQCSVFSTNGNTKQKHSDIAANSDIDECLLNNGIKSPKIQQNTSNKTYSKYHFGSYQNSCKNDCSDLPFRGNDEETWSAMLRNVSPLLNGTEHGSNGNGILRKRSLQQREERRQRTQSLGEYLLGSISIEPDRNEALNKQMFTSCISSTEDCSAPSKRNKVNLPRLPRGNPSNSDKEELLFSSRSGPKCSQKKEHGIPNKFSPIRRSCSSSSVLPTWPSFHQPTIMSMSTSASFINSDGKPLTIETDRHKPVSTKMDQDIFNNNIEQQQQLYKNCILNQSKSIEQQLNKDGKEKGFQPKGCKRGNQGIDEDGAASTSWLTTMAEKAAAARKAISKAGIGIIDKESSSSKSVHNLHQRPETTVSFDNGKGNGNEQGCKSVEAQKWFKHIANSKEFELQRSIIAGTTAASTNDTSPKTSQPTMTESQRQNDGNTINNCQEHETEALSASRDQMVGAINGSTEAGYP